MIPAKHSVKLNFQLILSSRLKPETATNLNHRLTIVVGSKEKRPLSAIDRVKLIPNIYQNKFTLPLSNTAYILFCITCEKLIILALLLNKLFVSSSFDDSSLLKNHYAVGVSYR